MILRDLLKLTAHMFYASPYLKYCYLCSKNVRVLCDSQLINNNSHLLKLKVDKITLKIQIMNSEIEFSSKSIIVFWKALFSEHVISINNHRLSLRYSAC